MFKKGKKSKARINKFLIRSIIYIAVLIALIWVLFPIYWVFSTSVKLPGKIFSIPPTLIPEEVTFENYQQLFKVMPFLQHFLNSAIITGGALVIGISLGSIAAYGLSRYHFPGSRYFLAFIVISRMIPYVAFVIPIFLLEANLRLLDTYPGVILAHLIIVLPFTVWLMKSFFDEIPKAYEEAALVDGCSRFRAMLIAMRLALPGLGTTAILTFLDSWNEFMFALTLTRTPASQTIPIALVIQLQRPYQVPWGVITAGSFLFSIPVFILGYFIQKYVARTFVLGV
ncbi:MAG: carbohydrate ABC transporter permease [Candidatus Baldrarchaeia archaeon]